MSRPRRLTATAALALLQEQNGDSDEEELDIAVEDDAEQSSDYQSEGERNTDNADSVSTAVNDSAGTSYMISRDGTKWQCQSIVPSNGRRSSRNVLRHRGGSKQFILSTFDDEVDIFSELLGPNTLKSIRNYTLEEAK